MVEFDNSDIDFSGVDDQRSSSGGGGFSSGGMALGGGGGLLAIVMYLVYAFLGNGGIGSNSVDPGQYSSGPGTQANSETTQEFKDRCQAQATAKKFTDTDCRLVKFYNIATTVWSQDFERNNLPFRPPRLAFFRQAVNTGCGRASADVGPFYCPRGETIYFDLNFLDTLQTQLGAQGDFAQAYIVAHEYGHHLQTLLGTESKVRAAQERNPNQTNTLSVKLELQADCYAGVWSNQADASSVNGISLTEKDMTEAMNAAAAVGDDTIQKQSGSQVDPDAFTHGTSAQRQQWFSTGYNSGSMDACNTFS